MLWLLLATVKSETKMVQLRKSGELPDPAKLSGSNSAGFTHEELLASLGSHVYNTILSSNMIISGIWDSAVADLLLH